MALLVVILLIADSSCREYLNGQWAYEGVSKMAVRPHTELL